MNLNGKKLSIPDLPAWLSSIHEISEPPSKNLIQLAEL